MDKDKATELDAMRTLLRLLSQATDDEDLKLGCNICLEYEKFVDACDKVAQYCLMNDDATPGDKRAFIAFLGSAKEVLESIYEDMEPVKGN